MKVKPLIYALAGFGLAGFASMAYAAPAANTPIGNQAKATFTDDLGTIHEVFSNTVVTLVEQVYALNLVQDNARDAVASSRVYFPHTVTNLGNGPDTFSLTAVPSAPGVLTGLAIYADINKDGVPDNLNAPITSTAALQAGESFSFIVSGIVPESAALGSGGTVLVTATSTRPLSPTYPAALSAANTDTFTVTNNAVLHLNKSVNIASGAPGTEPVVYTIRYINNGNSGATDLEITDEIPVGLEYIDGSARWHQSGNTALDDDGNANPAGIEFSYDDVARKLSYKILNVGATDSGFVSFSVRVPAGALPARTDNVAKFKYTTGGATTPEASTNLVPFQILQVVDFTLTPPAINPIPEAIGGSTVSWANVLVNNGNGTDTFDITIDEATSTFPAGTKFYLFQTDGNTPMTDSNGNGIPDTGPVGPGVSYNVVLKAVLPSDYVSPTPAVGYAVTKVARSSVDTTKADDATDRLTKIVGSSVDLTAERSVAGGATAADGLAHPVNGPIVTPTAGDAIIRTINTNPGVTVKFPLVVNNTGPRADSFIINAAMSHVMGSSNSVEQGWAVAFRSGAGNIVSSTDTVVKETGTFLFDLEVSVPATATPGVHDVYVRVVSPVTGAIDHIRVRVVVNTVRIISVQQDNQGQTFPGGSVEYEHVITNHGNVTEGTGSAADQSVIDFTLVNTPASLGFTSTLYYDANNNGILDAADLTTVITSTTKLHDIKPGGLVPGESIRVFVKVFSPLGVDNGAINQTRLTVNTTGVINTIAAPAAVANTDTTTIQRGDLVVNKKQAVDTDKSGAINGTEGPLVESQLIAAPGSVIIYQVTVTNTGARNVEGIVVHDAIPAHTTYVGGTATITGGTTNAITSAPAAGGTGSFVFDVGTLQPQQSSVIYFGVKIDE